MFSLFKILFLKISVAFMEIFTVGSEHESESKLLNIINTLFEGHEEYHIDLHLSYYTIQIWSKHVHVSRGRVVQLFEI